MPTECNVKIDMRLSGHNCRLKLLHYKLLIQKSARALSLSQGARLGCQVGIAPAFDN